MMFLAIPLRAAERAHQLQRALRALSMLVSHSLGRTVLDEVAIPVEIGHAAPRSCRLVRHARVSPW